MSKLTELAERVASGTGSDNELDVLVEIATFEPTPIWVAVRANNAGTKLIYTHADGSERTYRAADWTMRREATVAALRSLAAQEVEA